MNFSERDELERFSRALARRDNEILNELDDPPYAGCLSLLKTPYAIEICFVKIV